MGAYYKAFQCSQGFSATIICTYCGMPRTVVSDGKIELPIPSDFEPYKPIAGMTKDGFFIEVQPGSADINVDSWCCPNCWQKVQEQIKRKISDIRHEGSEEEQQGK